MRQNMGTWLFGDIHLRHSRGAEGQRGRGVEGRIHPSRRPNEPALVTQVEDALAIWVLGLLGKVHHYGRLHLTCVKRDLCKAERRNATAQNSRH